MAVAWWAWADSSGYTKRKVIEREERRKQDRIDRQKTNMGVKTSNGQRPRR
jgi:small Trp-rich protein